MLKSIVPLIAVLTYGLAADVDDCSLEESYWCSSLQTAKTCGALEHCKATVWQKKNFNQDESKSCIFCEAIIKDVENFVKQSETEPKITGVLTNACKMIPSKRKESKCESLVKDYVPEISDLVMSDVSSRVICSLLKLCVGLKNKVPHPQLPVSPVKPQLITKLSALPIQAEPICTDCRKFLTDIKNIIESNATEEAIESFVDQTVCSLLGTYKEMCEDLVKQFLPTIMQFIKTEFDPNMICDRFGFCAQTMTEAEAILNRKHKKSEFSAESDSFIDVIDGEALFELLVNVLDSEFRCRYLGFCADDSVIHDPEHEATPSKEPASNPVISVGKEIQCVLCEFVMKEVYSLLNKESTKEKLVGILLKVCDLVPPLVKTTCQSLLHAVGRQIIDKLIGMLDPTIICTSIGLCTKNEGVIPTKVQDYGL